MNKTALKNFAIYARNKLREDVAIKAGLIGVMPDGIKEPLESRSDFMSFDIGVSEPHKIFNEAIKKREALVNELKEREKNSNYKTAYESIIEEVAYTWFNRIIALRFMEVNNYIPDHIRVLSSGNPKDHIPEIINHALDTDLEFSDEEKEYIVEKKLEASTRALEELYQFLFLKKCNKLNEILPELFEKTEDYKELLITVSYSDTEGVIYKLINEVPEEDFDIEKEGQVEIIGWLYQYYNEERKNEVINIYKGTVKKEDIPAATQLFTTDWVVRYMVDNSLGRYWIERNPDSKLMNKLEYFMTPKNGEINYVNEEISPEDLSLIDPCMGSGHILVYAFDVLMEIYRERGYSDRNAARLIVEKNLYGLDIDKRAYQLSYFALMMKGRSYDNRFLQNKISPNIAEIVESITNIKFSNEDITINTEMNKIGEHLIETFRHGKEAGSLILPDQYDYDKFNRYLIESVENRKITLQSQQWIDTLYPRILKISKIASILSNKYKVACTNPPYLNKLEGNLKKFINKEYKDYKGDLFSAFIKRDIDFVVKGGYSAYMTPNVWMFIKSYEKLREYIIKNKKIDTLIQIAKGSFYKDATVDVMTFVIKNSRNNGENGLYIRLEDFKGGMEVQRQKTIEAIENKDCGYYYETSEENFEKIPGSPIAYWASEGILNAFEIGTKMMDIVNPKQGLATADNDRFLRYWWEPDDKKIKYDTNSTEESKTSGYKWVPYNKGGERRQWYGNYDYVVNWENDGNEIRNFKDSNGKVRSRPQNTGFYFKEAITWSLITSGGFSIRYRNGGGIHDVSGMSAFATDIFKLKYILGIMSTPIANHVFKMLNPTINLQIGDFNSFPIIMDKSYFEEVIKIVDNEINISKKDWDSNETSWDFTISPLLKSYNDNKVELLSTQYENYKNTTNDMFTTLKENEEELNRIFIEIYGLEDELTPDVSDGDITIAKIFETKEEKNKDMKDNIYALTREDVIKNFISYGVGCIFGRYSLDKEGLIFAGNIDGTVKLPDKYERFIPDMDGILPITDSKYFKDDIVTSFERFVEAALGKENLEENLKFIAQSLKNDNRESREVIREYFIKDFYKDHVKMYKKRPIYWLYDSGRENGFKALVYMHRYEDQTTARVRTGYLHELQKHYNSLKDSLVFESEHGVSAYDKKVALDRIKKLERQINECKSYDELIGHIANEKIKIDLDDGVKENYQKVQTGRDGKVLQILGKI